MREDSPEAPEEALTRRGIASRLGLGIGALLFYERLGLIPPPRRRANGYRVYSQVEADRLALILRAKGLGLSLKEISELLEGIDAGLPGEKLREGLLKKAESLQARIDELEAAKRALLEIAASPRLGNCETIRAVTRGSAPSRDSP
jgi:DNA-binding transcriptional MerR regulator